MAITATAATGTGDLAGAIEALERYRHRGIQPGLRRMQWLCEQLDHPERAAPAIHVTGTNGKGSTAKLASALLGATGRRVGQYTSPHFQDIRERIDIGGQPIARSTFVRLVDELLPVFDRSVAALGELVTHFDALTAVGLVAFRDAAVDSLVVEVGLGGRSDDTNVVDGAVAVVTNVDLDHTGFLGTTREEIADEKAGIIKEGAVAVIGETDSGLIDIFVRRCKEVDAVPWLLGRDFRVRRDVSVPFPGPHQATNAACALAAVEALVGESVPDEVARRAWSGLRFPGHFDVFGDGDDGPAFVVDVAHNVHGIKALVAALDERFGDRQRVVVFGASPDKDAAAMLRLLRPHTSAIVLTETRDAPHHRCDELAATAGALGFRRVLAEPEATDAIERAKMLASPDHVIVCTGSHYWLGAVYGHLTSPTRMLGG